MAMNPELQHLADLVEKFGWAKGFMRANQNDPNSRIEFTFTLGLPEKYDIPELIMYGLKEDVVNGVMQGVIEQLINAGGWKGGPLRLTGILNEHPVELRQVHEEHLPHVGGYNSVFRKHTDRKPLPGMIQIFWPGKDGKFPWDADATDKFPDQKRLDISWAQA